MIDDTKAKWDEDDETNKGINYFLREWSQRSSCNGLGNISGTNEGLRKFFWILLVLTGVVLTIYQVTDAVQKYYDYPYDVTIGLEQALSVDFPAVTVCNMNPARETALSNYTSSGQNTGGLSLSSTSDNTGAQRAQVTEMFLQNWASINISIREQIGHQLQETIVDCTYGGVSCDFATDFVSFNNVYHGNCWTFNSVNSAVTKTASRVGPTNGLSMEIYIDQAQYVSDLTEAAGVRLVVHDRSAFPFPEVFGINISPGKVTSLSVRRTKYTRLEEPYDSECYNASDSTVKSSDAYAGLHNLDYSYLGCVRTSYQATLLSKCGCADATVEFDREEVMSMLSNQTQIDMGFQPCKTGAEVSCVLTTTDKFYASSLFDCHLPCSEERYSFSVSESEWPNSRYSADYFAALENRYPMYSQTLRSDQASNNVLKVLVFYESINYETITESGSYDVWSLLADIGGVFGFWLGLSVIALFEFLELLVDLFILGYHFIKNKNHVKRMKKKTNPTSDTQGIVVIDMA